MKICQKLQMTQANPSEFRKQNFTTLVPSEHSSVLATKRKILQHKIYCVISQKNNEKQAMDRLIELFALALKWPTYHLGITQQSLLSKILCGNFYFGCQKKEYDYSRIGKLHQLELNNRNMNFMKDLPLTVNISLTRGKKTCLLTFCSFPEPEQKWSQRQRIFNQRPASYQTYSVFSACLSLFSPPYLL